MGPTDNTINGNLRPKDMEAGYKRDASVIVFAAPRRVAPSTIVKPADCLAQVMSAGLMRAFTRGAMRSNRPRPSCLTSVNAQGRASSL
jgi:hypothetical protein